MATVFDVPLYKNDSQFRILPPFSGEDFTKTDIINNQYGYYYCTNHENEDFLEYFMRALEHTPVAKLKKECAYGDIINKELVQNQVVSYGDNACWNLTRKILFKRGYIHEGFYRRQHSFCKKNIRTAFNMACLMSKIKRDYVETVMSEFEGIENLEAFSNSVATSTLQHKLLPKLSANKRYVGGDDSSSDEEDTTEKLKDLILKDNGAATCFFNSTIYIFRGAVIIRSEDDTMIMTIQHLKNAIRASIHYSQTLLYANILSRCSNKNYRSLGQCITSALVYIRHSFQRYNINSLQKYMPRVVKHMKNVYNVFLLDLAIRDATDVTEKEMCKRQKLDLLESEKKITMTGIKCYYDHMKGFEVEDKLNAGACWFSISPADIDPKLLLTTVTTRLNEPKPCNPYEQNKMLMYSRHAVSNHIISSRIYDIKTSNYVFPNKDYTAEYNNWRERNESGQLTQLYIDEPDLPYVVGILPWVESILTWPLSAQDVTFVTTPRHYNEFDDFVNHRRRFITNEMQYTTYKGDMISHNITTNDVLKGFYDGQRVGIGICVLAGKSENTKWDETVRETLSADNATRKVISMVDINLSQMSEFLPGICQRMSPNNLSKSVNDMFEFKDAVLISLDISGWSPNMIRRFQMDFIDTLLKFFKLPATATIKPWFNPMYIYIDKVGYSSFENTYDGSVQGFFGTADTILHSMIAQYGFYCAKKVGVARSDSRVRKVVLIDDIVLAARTDNPVGFYHFLVKKYNQLGFLIEHNKTIFSRNTCIFLNRIYHCSKEINTSTKLVGKVMATMEGKQYSLAEIMSVYINTTAAAISRGSYVFGSYYLMLLQIFTYFSAAGNVSQFNYDLVKFKLWIPPSCGGVGLPNIIQICTPDSESKFISCLCNICYLIRALGDRDETSTYLRTRLDKLVTNMKQFTSANDVILGNIRTQDDYTSSTFIDKIVTDAIDVKENSCEYWQDIFQLLRSNPCSKSVAALLTKIESGSIPAQMLTSISSSLPTSLIQSYSRRVVHSKVAMRILSRKFYNRLRFMSSNIINKTVKVIVEDRNTYSSECIENDSVAINPTAVAIQDDIIEHVRKTTAATIMDHVGFPCERSASELLIPGISADNAFITVKLRNTHQITHEDIPRMLLLQRGKSLRSPTKITDMTIRAPNALFSNLVTVCVIARFMSDHAKNPRTFRQFLANIFGLSEDDIKEIMLRVTLKTENYRRISTASKRMNFAMNLFSTFDNDISVDMNEAIRSFENIDIGIDLMLVHNYIMTMIPLHIYFANNKSIRIPDFAAYYFNENVNSAKPRMIERLIFVQPQEQIVERTTMYTTSKLFRMCFEHVLSMLGSLKKSTVIEDADMETASVVPENALVQIEEFDMTPIRRHYVSPVADTKTIADSAQFTIKSTSSADVEPSPSNDPHEYHIVDEKTKILFLSYRVGQTYAKQNTLSHEDIDEIRTLLVDDIENSTLFRSMYGDKITCEIALGNETLDTCREMYEKTVLSRTNHSNFTQICKCLSDRCMNESQIYLQQCRRDDYFCSLVASKTFRLISLLVTHASPLTELLNLYFNACEDAIHILAHGVYDTTKNGRYIESFEEGENITMTTIISILNKSAIKAGLEPFNSDILEVKTRDLFSSINVECVMRMPLLSGNKRRIVSSEEIQQQLKKFRQTPIEPELQSLPSYPGSENSDDESSQESEFVTPRVIRKEHVEEPHTPVSTMAGVHEGIPPIPHPTRKRRGSELSEPLLIRDIGKRFKPSRSLLDFNFPATNLVSMSVVSGDVLTADQIPDQFWKEANEAFLQLNHIDKKDVRNPLYEQIYETAKELFNESKNIDQHDFNADV